MKLLTMLLIVFVSLGAAMQDQFRDLYLASLKANREFVACLGEESISAPLKAFGDSLNVSAKKSVIFCHPPSWIGTVHTHINGNENFSTSDYAVMNWWERANGQRGKFCIVYSEEKSTCTDRRAR